MNVGIWTLAKARWIWHELVNTEALNWQDTSAAARCCQCQYCCTRHSGTLAQSGAEWRLLTTSIVVIVSRCQTHPPSVSLGFIPSSLSSHLTWCTSRPQVPTLMRASAVGLRWLSSGLTGRPYRLSTHLSALLCYASRARLPTRCRHSRPGLAWWRGGMRKQEAAIAQLVLYFMHRWRFSDPGPVIRLTWSSANGLRKHSATKLRKYYLSPDTKTHVEHVRALPWSIASTCCTILAVHAD